MSDMRRHNAHIETVVLVLNRRKNIEHLERSGMLQHVVAKAVNDRDGGTSMTGSQPSEVSTSIGLSCTDIPSRMFSVCPSAS